MGDSKGLVLVVEDERAIADLVRLYLAREGFGVHVEADGVAGLAAARRLHPVAIVLDVGLPSLDGTELCRRLRANGDWTPVLFVTARARGGPGARPGAGLRRRRYQALRAGGAGARSRPCSAGAGRREAIPQLAVGRVRLDQDRAAVRREDGSRSPHRVRPARLLLRRPAGVSAGAPAVRGWGYAARPAPDGRRHAPSCGQLG